MSNLPKNILATICYYDVMDYPLTIFEVWKYLIRSDYFEENLEDAQVSLGEVEKELEEEKLKRFVERRDGFYFLRGRENLVKQRIARNAISCAKIKKLVRIVRILSLVPFVKMIATTGRLAMKNAQNSSDWDLLIVIKKGRIWTGRTLVTLVVHILGKRRYGKKIKDRVCLNYFITNESLEIKTKNIFSAHEYFFCFPVFDTGEFSRFRIKNRWIKNFKPNYELEELGALRTLRDTKTSRLVRKLLEIFFDFDFFENFLRKWEKEKIAANPKTDQEGSMVEATDENLIFLPAPQGPKIFEKFKNNIKKLE